MFSTARFCLFIGLTLVPAWAWAETARWEPGKVVSVEQIVTPAKTPDPSCRTVPRGETLPARCRPDNLRAEQYWRVTIDVGNKRYVVRPYRAPKFIDVLNQSAVAYVDPNLAAGASVQVAVYANQSIRIRTGQGDGLPATLDSEDTIGAAAVTTPVVAQQAAPISPVRTTAAEPPGPSKVVLLEHGDFIDLEVQPLKSQEIGDGAVLYSFGGNSSHSRINSNPPVFLIMGANEAAELASLQVGKETRQLLYSSLKKRSASPVAVTVTQVSDTLRRVTLSEPLPPGEYAFLLPDSGRAFLFAVR